MTRGSGGVRLLVAALWVAAALPVGVALGQAAIGDILIDRLSTQNQVAPVVFPHWKHRLRFKCYACHPKPFEMQAGANEITMDKLRAGEFCGRCHNGRIAFAVSFDTCRTCHLGPMPVAAR